MVSVMMLALLCACTQKTDTVDYSKSENWAYYGIGEGKDADLFLICPTVDMGKNENYNMSMEDERLATTASHSCPLEHFHHTFLLDP